MRQLKISAGHFPVCPECFNPYAVLDASKYPLLIFLHGYVPSFPQTYENWHRTLQCHVCLLSKGMKGRLEYQKLKNKIRSFTGTAG